MFSITANGKEYKIKFGYGVLRKTNLIDRVININNQLSKNPENAFQNLMTTVAELLLAGLQKSHKDEFGYETDREKETVLDKIDDLMDSYEDEGTDENPQDCYMLFEMLKDELMKNGFLSRMANQTAEEVAIEQDATVVPKDHKKKAN